MAKRLIEAVIIGDEHFGKGKKIFKRPKFITPIRKPGGGRPPKDKSKQKPKKKLTKEEKDFNKEQRALHVCVENPFAWIKNNFKSTSKPWQEDDDNLSHVIYFATGCFNNLIQKIDYKCIC